MYKDYLEHEIYGKLWFTATLRNWNGMGLSMMENVDLGPLFEISLCDFNVVGSGCTLDQAVRHMEAMLEHYEKRNEELPTPLKRRSRWQQWKMNRLFKKFQRDNLCNPVK